MIKKWHTQSCVQQDDLAKEIWWAFETVLSNVVRARLIPKCSVNIGHPKWIKCGQNLVAQVHSSENGQTTNQVNKVKVCGLLQNKRKQCYVYDIFRMLEQVKGYFIVSCAAVMLFFCFGSRATTIFWGYLCIFTETEKGILWSFSELLTLWNVV